MQRSEWVRFFALLYFYTAIGLGYGQIMARMPELTAAAHAHEADVGLALFCMGLGSIAGFAIAPRVQNRFPSATVLTWSVVIFMLLLPVTPLAFSPQTLCIMFALFGACFAFCEVSVNLQGVALEHLLKRSALSRLQSGYSLGGLGGSVIGALLVKFSVPLFDSLAVTCLILIVFILLLRRFLLPEDGGKVKFVGPAPRPPALPFKVWWAGIIIALIFGVEGTCAEWSALYLTEVKEALPAQAALAFGTFALSVTLVRFMGDTLKDRFGPSRLVLCSIVTAALGQLIVLLSHYTLLCLVGYALTGAGIGPPDAHHHKRSFPRRDPLYQACRIENDHLRLRGAAGAATAGGLYLRARGFKPRSVDLAYLPHPYLKHGMDRKKSRFKKKLRKANHSILNDAS